MFRATALRALRHSPSTLRSSITIRPPSLRCRSQFRPFSSSQPNSVVYVRFGNRGSSEQDPNSKQNPEQDPHNDFRKKKRLPINNPVLWGLGVGAGAYYVAHLEQIPETGRWRFMNVSQSREEQLGKMARDQTIAEYRQSILPPNHVLSKHVKRVVTRILAASNLGHIRGESSSEQYLGTPPVPVVMNSMFGGGQDEQQEATWDPDSQRGSRNDSSSSGRMSERQWDVIVVNDSKTINAMAVPGLIIVFTGILPVCKDEQGLSAVLAHEIGHVVARHSAERLASQTVYFAVILALSALLGTDMGLTSFMHNLLVELPNSRTQEYEADKIGLRLMSKACYDPKAAVEMFERLTKIEGGRGVDFFATHPSGTKRVEELEKLLPEAYGELQGNPDCGVVPDRMQAFREVALGSAGW